MAFAFYCKPLKWQRSSVKHNNETKPLGFESYKEPIKFLGINLSYKYENNYNLNFFIKIYKMDTKLNIWQTRDLTLFGRTCTCTMLVKTLGLSKLVYAASSLVYQLYWSQNYNIIN